MIVQHCIEETNQRVEWREKRYMLRSVECICYIFIPKILFSVNGKKPLDKLTPEAMVKAILEEPRARTLMQRLTCETVNPKVRRM